MVAAGGVTGGLLEVGERRPDGVLSTALTGSSVLCVDGTPVVDRDDSVLLVDDATVADEAGSVVLLLPSDDMVGEWVIDEQCMEEIDNDVNVPD